MKSKSVAKPLAEMLAKAVSMMPKSMVEPLTKMLAKAMLMSPKLYGRNQNNKQNMQNIDSHFALVACIFGGQCKVIEVFYIIMFWLHIFFTTQSH